MPHSRESISKQQPDIEQEIIAPKVFNRANDAWYTQSPEVMGGTLANSYKMSEEGIKGTSIVIDDRGFLYKGSQTPKWLDRIIRGKRPENQGKGSVVRVTTVYRGRERTEGEVNHTSSHEFEHAAQADRRDIKVLLGNVAVWGLASLGAVAGYRLGKNIPAKVAGVVIGGMMGQVAGYKIAPHENQAREKAAETPLSLIKKKDLSSREEHTEEPA